MYFALLHHCFYLNTLYFCAFRAALGVGSGPAASPKDSRLVAAIFLELAHIYRYRPRLGRKEVLPWGVIVKDYHSIRSVVLNCGTLKRDTSIQLFQVNERTVRVW